MDRRSFLVCGLLPSSLGLLLSAVGCKNRQVAHVLDRDDQDMVGSHAAGAETWKPLIDESVAKLLGRQQRVLQTVSHQGAGGLPMSRKRVCFLGVENKSVEEIGDFKEQIYEHVDTLINHSETFSMISRRFVEAGLREAHISPNDLFVPSNQRMFTTVMEQMQQPFDYLLFAKITSGTTTSNKNNYQRDYLLTLEMVNMNDGTFDKESAMLRKGYHKSKLGIAKHY
ncbi:MAG: penicillin-binding protein activator LpoB [Planctomycetaceae bacterium]|nr:penicillin-binding protein activator LpoB [Planctomycetaceae bacterium]